jgi:hypothetical protein
MTNAFCYSGYSWRVWVHNRFAGYVVAASEMDAMIAAKEKFQSSYIWVERMSASPT